MSGDCLQRVKYKFYLDANHSVIINGQQGDIHPHTWEFLIKLKSKNNDFVKFSDIEKVINKILEQYQNRYINEVIPFNDLNPTSENMATYFKNIIEDKMKTMQWELLSMELSEAPNRAIVLQNKNNIM